RPRTGVPDRLHLRKRGQRAARRHALRIPAHGDRGEHRCGVVRRHACTAGSIRTPNQAEDLSRVMLFLLTWLGLVLIRPQEYPALIDLGIPILPIAMLAALAVWQLGGQRRPLTQPTYL